MALIIDDPFVVEIPRSSVHDECINSYICRLSKTTNGNTVWRTSCCSGLAVDVLALITNDIDATFELYAAKDGMYGGIENGSWTGIIGEIQKGHADIGIQGLTPNVQRMADVDFTEHFMQSAIAIVKKHEVEELQVVNWRFLNTLQKDLLLAKLVSFIVVLISLYTYEKCCILYI